MLKKNNGALKICHKKCPTIAVPNGKIWKISRGVDDV